MPPLEKGATGDLLLILLQDEQQQKQIPLNPPFSKGEAKAECLIPDSPSQRNTPSRPGTGFSVFRESMSKERDFFSSGTACSLPFSV